MELTPQQLCDVEFSEQWRGYNRDQVDDFIERVAAAVSTLQDRLRKMTERTVRADRHAQEGTEADGAARRTLVLAQRTADATVAEAKETSARLIAQAQEEARAIILAAETSVEALPTAEPTARAQIADLEVTRSRLQADVAALESHVTDRRASIKGLLDELQRRVDEGFDGRIGEWPSPGDSTLSDERDQYYDDLTGVSPRDVDDDTFFAQLRGALDDDAPLGPREDPQGVLRWKEQAATAVAEAPSLYDQGQPERRKFGRKKRRQP